MLSTDPSLQRTFAGHRGAVTALACSATSPQLASGGSDNSVMVWNLKPSARAFRFVGHTGPVTSVSFSPDGTLLASASKDGTMRLWRPTVCVARRPRSVRVDCSFTTPHPPTRPIYKHSQGKSESYRPHTGAVRSVAFSPDGKSLLTAGHDKTLKIFAVGSAPSSLRFVRSLSGHAHWVLAGAWSPDGTRIVSASEDATVRVWDAETGVCLSVLYDFSEAATCVAFSPDGRTIAAGGAEGAVKLWDARAPTTVLLQHYAAHEGEGGVSSLAWHPSGCALLTTGASDALARLWDVREGHLNYTVHGHVGASAGVAASAFMADGNHFSTAGSDGAVMLWRVDIGTGDIDGAASNDALLARAAGGMAASVERGVAAASADSRPAVSPPQKSNPASMPSYVPHAAPSGGSPSTRAAPIATKTRPQASGTNISSTSLLESEPSLGMVRLFSLCPLARVSHSALTVPHPTLHNKGDAFYCEPT